MKRVLTWQHKHGRELYAADTDEQLEKSARKVLKTLLDWGYIYEPDVEPDFRYQDIDFELVALSDEQVNALPTESLRECARRHKKKHANVIREHERELARYEEAVKVAAGEEVWITDRGVRRTGPNAGEYFPPMQVTAWRILESRNGAEYEIFDIEHITDPDDDDE